MTAAVIDPAAFDTFLDDVDKAVRGAYETAGATDDVRVRSERQMVWAAEIPEILEPAVAHLLGAAAERFTGSVRSMTRLLEADVSWLGLSEADASSNRKRGLPKIDAVRKVPLIMTKAAGAGSGWGVTGSDASGKRRIRRCARCGSFMEDLHPKERHPAWLLQMHKECVCSGAWVLVDA